MASMFMNNMIANFAFAESFSVTVLGLIALVVCVIVRNIIIKGMVITAKE